jgi:hypothetical protein
MDACIVTIYLCKKVIAEKYWEIWENRSDELAIGYLVPVLGARKIKTWDFRVQINALIFQSSPLITG